MKKVYFSIGTDGFYGTHYESSVKTKFVCIVLLCDELNDHMAKCGAKWLHQLGVNVMAMSARKKITVT